MRGIDCVHPGGSWDIAFVQNDEKYCMCSNYRGGLTIVATGKLATRTAPYDSTAAPSC